MEITGLLFRQMLVLFAMMVTGFLAFRRGIFGKTGQREISALIVRILNPFLMISSILANAGDAGGPVLLQNLAMVGIYYALLIVVSFVYVRLRRFPDRDKCLQQLMLVLSNIGFLGIPVVRAVYGPQYVLYVVFYMLVFNVLAYTYGIYLASGLTKDRTEETAAKTSAERHLSESAAEASTGQHLSKSQASAPRRFEPRRIINIGTISSLIAILLFLFRPPVPAPVQDFCTYMGNACIPLSMILIGGSLAQLPLREIFRVPENYIFTILKMLVIPAAGILLFRGLPFDEEVKRVFYLLLSMPVASLAGMLAEEYGGSGNEINKVTAMTTIVSVVTIPLLALLY